VAEQHGSEARDVQRDRMGQRRQPLDVAGAQLPRGPRCDRVGNRRVAAPGPRPQFAVGIATHPHDAVTERVEPIEHRDRLGAGGDVAREDDAVHRHDIGFGEHGLECGQDTVDVRQHRGRRNGRWSSHDIHGIS
jgi:hypothetical protein